MLILNIRIDNLSKPQVRQKVSEFLTSNTQHKIFTPNPEMLVDARKDEYFKKVLNSGDLNVCDGFGLSLVSGATRIPGTDLMQDICRLAAEQGRSVYLLGSGSDEVVKKTAEALKNKFSQLRIVGYSKGGKIERSKDYKIGYDKEENDDVLHDIIMKAPDILFVAFGHGKQEKWIHENLPHLPSVKIAMGVGGAFDYISGKTKRAPLFLRQIGLEWLYRLFREPFRLKRILKATVIFLYYVIFK